MLRSTMTLEDVKQVKYWLEQLLPDYALQTEGTNPDGTPIRANYDEIAGLVAKLDRDVKGNTPLTFKQSALWIGGIVVGTLVVIGLAALFLTLLKPYLPQ